MKDSFFRLTDNPYIAKSKVDMLSLKVNCKYLRVTKKCLLYGHMQFFVILLAAHERQLVELIEQLLQI